MKNEDIEDVVNAVLIKDGPRVIVWRSQNKIKLRKLESQWFFVTSVYLAKEYSSQNGKPSAPSFCSQTERAFVYFRRIIKS